ncbi:hypothetical protein BFJ72_g5424 [Fusarium proliferatum]|uniref:Transcription factor domain-containing protein n=1 Tax=Gibberella intermedia TaxID=948311 RepID=A0A420TJ33_GIBIN|nr:hypothetical protein BFJ72_g5424 [Fusarium proliferatum]
MSGCRVVLPVIKFIDETELIVDGYLVLADHSKSSPDAVENESGLQAVFSQCPSAPGQCSDEELSPNGYHASNASDPVPLQLTSPTSRDQTSPGDCQTSPQGSGWGDFLDQSPAVFLTPNEANLLNRFTQVVGQWMDLSDLSQTWSKLVPHFAIRASLVKECCVACAAKQLALSNPQSPGTEEWMRQAQSSYSIAIAQLIRHVSIDCPAPSPETFVATVLCSVYEMMDATGSDWQAHLEGISQIGKIRGINGTCGGLEEAGFWCFARQEVVCCLINRSKPRIDPESWYEILGQRTEVGREDMANRRYALQ